jgi:hypothetical protein
MCYPSGTSFSSAAEAAAALAAKFSSVKDQPQYEFLYADSDSSFRRYPSGAALNLIKAGYDCGVGFVEYSIDSTPFAVVFVSRDEMYQVNLVSGTTRRIVRREVIAAADRVFALDLPHMVAARVAQAEAEAKLFEANLASIPVPVYTSLTWTVESKDAHRPHPFAFEASGQAGLESAFQSFMSGGFHLYAYGDLLIDFKSLTQTNTTSGTVRKLARVAPSSSSGAGGSGSSAAAASENVA